MKITDLQIISFEVTEPAFQNGQVVPEARTTQTLMRIHTDEGAEGYYLGGQGHGDRNGLGPAEIDMMLGRIRSLIVGQNPFDRERIWHWMWVANIPEEILSAVDCTLWDLQGRLFGVPVHKLLGGCRDKVPAYGSTFPNIGSPETYASHAAECQARGYRHYKIHPYYFWNPATGEPDPGRPSHIDWDIAACRLVREAVGPDMVLSFDPWGTYRTYEEAVKVGRVLEELDFYWYEHPMNEFRVSNYEKLSRELSIPILSPEIAHGSIYTRADWIKRGASDMSRIDVLRGGITGGHKMIAICEGFGVRCEVHMSGHGNLALLGASSEDTCGWYERGLLAPGLDYEVVPPYLNSIGDPMDDEGYVAVPTRPGLGYDLNWDFIHEHGTVHAV